MPPDLSYPPTELQPIVPVAVSRGPTDGRDAAADALLRRLAPTAAGAAGDPDTDHGPQSDPTLAAPPDEATGSAAADVPPAAGGWYGRFLLLEEIGQGAFSQVFLARQPDLAGRTVVVKVTAAADREAHALARLRHPNIVPVHSTHRVGRRQLVCMPFLGTVTLADVYRALEHMPALPDSGDGLFSTLPAGRPPTLRPDQPAEPPAAAAAPRDASPVLASLAGRSYVEAVLWLAARLADALAHAHDRGIVHTDLKPANVLLADDGQPVLLDFNLAAPAAAAPGAVRGGTPQYMSPEQLDTFAGRPRPVDGRADVYALGLVLYELLSRRSPFARHKPVDADALRAMLAERAGPPPRLRPWNRAVSPAAEAIVRRCLEPDPAARYRSAHHLRDDLERHLAHRPLAHATEPSDWERVRKWGRRNGRPVAALLAGLVVAATAGAVRNVRPGGQLDRPVGGATVSRFDVNAQAAEVLPAGDRNPALPHDGLGCGEAAPARLDPAARGRVWVRAGEPLTLPAGPPAPAP